jgi:hypothetical protein
MHREKPGSSKSCRDQPVGAKPRFREIAFIDSAVADSGALLSGLRPEVEAILLPRTEPAVEQMVQALEGRENIEAIHVLAHGRPGEVSFAAGALSSQMINEIAGLPRFGAALGTEGTLFLWSCQTGAGKSGAAFIDALARKTGARVAAASGLVGAASRQGTWILDRGSGPGRQPLTPEATTTFAGVLATFTGTNGNDRADATTGILTGFSGGTVAQLQDSTGDVFNGGNGADAIVAGNGNDTINLGSGQFVAGETIQGGGNTSTGTRDQIVLTSGTTVDFSVGTVSGIETLTGSSASDTVTMTASQWVGFSTINLGSGSADVVNIQASGNISTLGTPTLSGVEIGNIVGTSGNDVVTLSGGQLNAILIGSGTINLGAATSDTINLTSTSSDLNTLGATDVSIQGIEAISAAGAAAGITVNLNGQTEGFSLIGSSQADSITGGSAADAIGGGGGADILSAGLGNDTLTGAAGNDMIDGGGGTDTAVFGGARADYAVSLSGTTYTLIDSRGGSPDGTDAVTNVENFQFSDGTLSASQLIPPPPTTPSNKIALENMKQGNPISEWGIDGDGGGTIQGFATEISTNVGGTVDFKIATESANYRIEIYRLGYYGGDGARRVDTVDVNLASAQVQPHPIVDMSRGLIDCGNWAVSASWEIPEDAVSGVYIAKLIREDGTEDAAHIPFIVRDDSSTSDIVFQTSDTTWQAYNAWGGASLYFGQVPVDPADMIGYMPPNCSCGLNSIGRASAVSYNRPFITNTSPVGGTHDFIFGVEHSAIRWIEQNGYDVSYISGVDTTRSGSLLLNHEAFLSVGHDEYWSAEQRANVEAARDSGVDLAFWSGNEVYWKVRWETSIDGNGTPYRTMVCYKETWGGTPDPSSIGTGTWRDPRYADPGQEPENSLTGTMFTVDSYRLDTITIPYDYSNLRFWRNTDVAELESGQTYSLVQNLLGYEWDSDVENGFRPAGLINMSLSTVSVETYLRDYGTAIGSADVTHSLTMYRAESGALVFGAGTVFWSWGLDSEHEGAATPTDPNVQQAMVNMFADMGIQPTTLDASLILATQSTDTAKPTATITSPTLGASFVEGQKVTIAGTAQDFGGGIIAGVEVSVDGGQSWWKATGRETWSYAWNVQASGTYTILARAVDDSLNLGTPSSGVQVTVNLPSTKGLWSLASKPTTETTLDGETIDRSGVELGVQFQASTGGLVKGIRFYKGFYNVGPHTVNLWTSNGTLLTTGLSVGESLTGWQTVTFSAPVRIDAGTTYLASYHTEGYWSSTENYFTSTYTNGPLTVQPGGSVYAYSNNPGTFPTNSPSSKANYWVDVVFDPDPNIPPVATDDSFSVGKNGILTLSFSLLTVNDSDPNGNPLTVTAVGGASNGTVSLDPQTGTVVFTPTAGYSGQANFTYTVSDGLGGTDTGTVEVTVDEEPAGVSLFQNNEGPAGGALNDGLPIELGMKFTASANGAITGIRFYKPAGATGEHTGSLWSSTGTQLATVTFTHESTSGWQLATFSNPVQITKGVTYVASYHTTGTYVADANYFTTARTMGPLTALSSAGSGGNGVFAYGNSAFPTGSYLATNYWVDVVFEKSTVNELPIASNDNGFTAHHNTPLALATSALLVNDTDPDGDQLQVTAVGEASNGTVSLDPQTGTVVFTPTAGYSGQANFTYTVSDGRGGTDTGQVSLNVVPPDEQNLFSSNATPTTVTINDSGDVNLGMKFQADVAGTITGLRFYKGPSNVGSHTGYLWTSTGTLLANATFTNEGASGWQSVNLTQPVEIQANTTYVVSYSTDGFYSATGGFFNSEFANADLTGLASGLSGGNGVYAYGPSGLFPTNSYNASNYYVDVAFRPQLAA